MEMEDGLLDDETFEELADECDLLDTWRPQVTLYHRLGLSKRDLSKLANSRRDIFMLSVGTVKSKLNFLREQARSSARATRTKRRECAQRWCT
jgi:hypothetical protein